MLGGRRWLTRYESFGVTEVEDDSPGNGQVAALDEHPLGREARRPTNTFVSDASFGDAAWGHVYVSNFALRLKRVAVDRC